VRFDMLEALDITEEQAAGLDELAAIDLRMAKVFAARAEAEEDLKAACELARTSQRYARAYRQILLLKARLKREMAQAAAAERPSEDQAAHIGERKARLRERLRKDIISIYSEYEHPDDDEHDLRELLAWLDGRLDALARSPLFVHEPFERFEEGLLHELDAIVETYVQAPEPEPDTQGKSAAVRPAAVAAGIEDTS
jgi:hypothetical protein